MTDEDSIFDLYHKVHKELIRTLRHMVEPYEFTRGELPVLVRLVKEGDGISQKEMRDDLPISKSTMSKTIDNLARKEYIKKERNAEDRRVTRIYLSEKGEQVGRIIREIDTKAEQIMLRDFGEREKEELRGHLKKMLRNLSRFSRNNRPE